MRASKEGSHISGAEGIYKEEEINEMVSSYMRRAFEHAKGSPDKLKIKVESIHRKPCPIPLLDIMTLVNGSERGARSVIWELLCHAGISGEAIRSAVRVIFSEEDMRGAAIIHARSGKRLEPDTVRGVRATGIGIIPAAMEELSKGLASFNIDNDTVREAVLLASKVASHEAVIAELCVSDDPDYTTGYIAGSSLGYIRVPHIKGPGSPAGGRVFFIRDEADADDLIDFLQNTPVMITDIGDIHGEVSQGEFFSRIAG